MAERTVQLELANTELKAFAYSVSHDLRAPLRAIEGFSRLLLEEHLDRLDHKGQHYLQRVRSNAQKMDQLIQDLLAFSRMGRAALDIRPVQPTAIARQVFSELRREEPTRQVQFSLTDLPSCQADAALLKQVFVNLLSNALKFTRQERLTHITVGYRQTGSEGAYFVQDNGVGFDMRYIDKLFGVFQRLHSVEEFEGTGVGLAIIKRIIHRHGGLVWAESYPNQGATFFFTLPDVVICSGASTYDGT